MTKDVARRSAPLPDRSGIRGNTWCTLLGVAVVTVSGCDVVTAAPSWETRWRLPGEATTIGVDELLPTGVGIAAGGLDFSVTVDPFSLSRSLGGICPGCAPLQGLVVPKPAFTVTLEDTVDLSGDITEAELSRGTAVVEVTNGFSFDPIRPGGTITGRVIITVLDGDAGGRVLDQVIVDGASRAFAPGATIAESVDLDPGPIGATLRTRVVIESPSGTPVQIDLNESVSVTARPDEFLMRSARVKVSNQRVTIDEVDLDVGHIDGELVDRVQSGAFALDIDNPFNVQFEATLRVLVPGGDPIVKGLTIDAGQTAPRVEFTGAELRSFLGREDVILVGEGLIAPDAAPILVTPDLEALIEGDFDLVLAIGDRS